MKVIKHGNTARELTCPVCGCIFKAVGTDTCYKPIQRKAFQRYKPMPRWESFFACPECGHECGEEDYTE